MIMCSRTHWKIFVQAINKGEVLVCARAHVCVCGIGEMLSA